MPQTFSEHQIVFKSFFKTHISWISPRDSDLVGLGWILWDFFVFVFLVSLKSISPSDVEERAIKSFVLPDVASLDEEDIWPLNLLSFMS